MFINDSRILSAVFVALILISDISEAYAADPIVYSRCTRTSQSLTVTGDITIDGVKQTRTRTLTGLDTYDVLPDVTNFFDDFTAPCDLMYYNPDTEESRVLYNCTDISTDADACAALDPAVSFDGKTIIFSLFKGRLKNQGIWHPGGALLDPDADNVVIEPIISPPTAPGVPLTLVLPNKILKSKGAHLIKVNIASGAISPFSYVEGVFDTGPAWLANGRIAFVSTRDGHTTTAIWRINNQPKGTRIWTMDQDGRNVDLASHHSLSMEQHPYPLKDGRLAYSSWQVFGPLPFRQGGARPGTIDNQFHIYTQAPDGAGNFPFYGQHSGDHRASYFGAGHVAAHFLAQTSNERVWFSDYYRANNNALGSIVGVMPEPEGQEGKAPDEVTASADLFVPRDAVAFALWSFNNDSSAKVMSTLANGAEVYVPNYKYPMLYAGKVGHPGALSNNGLMVSWGKGPCAVTSGQKIFDALGLPMPRATGGSGWVRLNSLTYLNEILPQIFPNVGGAGDSPGCDLGIYKATKSNPIRSEHPSDLEMIVDSPDWHEIMARAAVPYSAIFGVDKPKLIERADIAAGVQPQLPTGTPFGLLGAASITDRETHPHKGIKFAGSHQQALQGTDTINYSDEDLCGIRILGVMPNRSTSSWSDLASLAGERVSIIGEFPVLHRDAKGNRIMDPSGNADTSFLTRMPANTPYMMQGVDCDGRTLNTDFTWQALRPGENKTCGGCHVHSKPSRIDFADSFAATSNYSIPQIGEGIVPLLAGKSGNNVNVRNVGSAAAPVYGMRIDYTKDIEPIFNNRCISCHGGNSPSAGLALDRGAEGADNFSRFNAPITTWDCLLKDRAQSCLPESNRFVNHLGSADIQRPQLTKYIRSFNSRGSLLYWKAANRRADNNTDESIDGDIDFGANHPTSITANELGVLSRWIDIGAPGGGDTELLDTQKPTLHLAATVIDGVVKELRIGTVDLGSGIAPNTLEVCIGAGRCSVATAAKMHGITVIPVSESDPSTEITATIKDKSGNITTVSRTVQWFVSNGDMSPPEKDTTDPVTSVTSLANGDTSPPEEDTTDPVTSVTSPANGVIVAGTVTITANAADNVGVSRVEFYIDGALGKTVASSPYRFTWNTSSFNNVNKTIKTRAYDAAGNVGVSSTITVTVDNGAPADTATPSASITSPSNGVTLSGTTTITATASDNVGVSRVEFYADGALLGSDSAEPYEFRWAATARQDGTQVLSTRAYDAAGNVGTSQNVIINVDNSSGVNIKLREGLNGYTGTSDSYLYSSHNKANFGERDLMHEAGNFNALVRFAIFESEGGPVPDGASITSATLSLYKTSHYNYRYSAHRLLKDWREDLVTWDKYAAARWNSPGASGIGSDIHQLADGEGAVAWAPGWLNINVTNGVQLMSINGNNFGWRLVGISGNGNIKQFASSESVTNPTLRPTLDIHYSTTTLPPAVSLSAPAEQ